MIARLTPYVHGLARCTALIGGLALIALVLLTVTSILLRNFSSFGPVPGDFELVEAGVAFAIFAFMPWCQLNRGHATVEIFASRFGIFFNGLIDFLADAALLGLWVYLSYRHYLGMLDKQSYNETTFILQFPVWWAYLAGFIGIIVIVLVAAFCVLRAFGNLRKGQRPQSGGALH